MEKVVGTCRVICIIFAFLANTPVHAEEVSTAPVAEPYLLRLAHRVLLWRDQLLDMDASANRAAEQTIAGGNLYAFGPQHSFAPEIVSRAGGLMLARQYSPEVRLTARDTVLAALVGAESVADRDALRPLLSEAEKAGAQVVLFGAADQAQVRKFSVAALPRDPQAFADDPSIASVSNVVGMWAWTGRFIAACTQRGKMPCMYQSAILPDGRQRTAILEQRDEGRFHLVSAVRPEDADRIAEIYLTAVEHALREVWSKERVALQRSADQLRASRDRGNAVVIYTLGHMFPGEFDQPQQPDWLVHSDALQPDATVDTAVVLHYMSFPWEVVDKIHTAKQAGIVTCSQPALPAFTTKPGNIYINPHWSIHDAAVELPNYDVRVLPVSGVLDAAVYWQMVEWAMAEQD